MMDETRSNTPSLTCATVTVGVLLSLTACGGSGGGADGAPLNREGAPTAAEPLDTRIDATPPATSNTTTAVFEFSAANGTATAFQYSLDDAPFQDTPSPLELTGLAEGEHRIAIRAVDGNGTADSTPAVYTWTVDTLPPTPTLFKAPAVHSNDSQAQFDIGADEPVEVWAALDNDPLQAVSIPFTVSGLTEGPHELRYQVIDTAGNASAVERYTWTTDLTAPQLTIHFPSLRVITTTETLSIRGIAGDELSGIESVTINDTTATTDDDFHHWNAPISLTPGDNILSITAVDGAGNTTTAPALTVVRTTVLLDQPDRLVLDEAGNRLLVVTAPDIVAVDLNSGARSFIASTFEGRGIDLVSPTGIALDPLNQRLIVADRGLRAVVEIALNDGQRQELSGPNRGSGPPLDNLRDIDVIGSTAYTLDANLGTAVRIDLDTGARTVLNPPAQPAGQPQLLIAQDLAYTPADGNPALVMVDLLDPTQLFSQRLSDNVRSTLTPATGVALIEEARRLTTNPATGQIIISDTAVNGLLAADAVSGNQQLLSDNTRGEGIPLIEPRGIAVTSDGQKAYVSDFLRETVVEVNLNTGDRRSVTDDFQGSGPALDSVQDMAFADDRLYALLNDPFRIFVIDTTSGDRLSMATNESGSGPVIHLARQLALRNEANGAAAYVLARYESPAGAPPRDGIVRVALDTGQRQVVVADLSALGTGFEPPGGSAMVAAGDRLLFFVPFAEVDPTTGTETTLDVLVAAVLPSGELQIVSGPERGQEPSPSRNSVVGVAVDPTRQILFAADTFSDSLLAIDLEQGRRAIVSTAIAAPIELEFSPDTNELLVSHQLGQAISAVDIDTGDAHLLTADTRGSGPLLNGPGITAYAPRTDTLYLYEQEGTMLIAVDPASGDRVIFSR